MQDGEVKGTEMPISFDVCSSVVFHFFIPQPPPRGFRDHPFPLCKPPLSHQENTALSALC